MKDNLNAFDTSGQKLFVGTEYEGPNVGLRTLFIQGPVPNEHITRALEEDKSIQMLYFGAGRLSAFWLGTLVGISLETEEGGSLHGKIITLESPDCQLDLVRECPHLYHMLTITMPERPIADEKVWAVLIKYHEMLTPEQKARVIVKIDTGKYVMCVRLTEFSVNDYSGYANDKLLWEETK